MLLLLDIRVEVVLRFSAGGGLPSSGKDGSAGRRRLARRRAAIGSSCGALSSRPSNTAVSFSDLDIRRNE